MKHLPFILALLVAVPLAGAELTFQPRGGGATARSEGIRPADRSGGFFELVGVHLQPSPRRLDAAAALQLSFSLAEPVDLSVKVWDPESNYEMVPAKTRFGPGEIFAWPQADVIGPLGIDVTRLGVLALASERRVYHPARLTTEPGVGKADEIEFVFESRGGVDLRCVIVRESPGGALEEVHSRRFADDFGGRITFTWNGAELTVHHSPVHRSLAASAPQVYHLRIDGTIYMERDEPIHLDIPFFFQAAR